MNVLAHLQTGDVSRAHLMRCLATQVCAWPPHWQVKFLKKWKKEKGAESHAELVRLMQLQPERDLLAGRAALKQLKNSNR